MDILDKNGHFTKTMSQMTKEEKAFAMQIVKRDFEIAFGIGKKKAANS